MITRTRGWKMVMLAAAMMGSIGTGAGWAKTPSLSDARADYQEGDLYQARKKTQKILDKNKDDQQAQILMAEIIDQEIARHKEAFASNVPEEIPDSEKEEETKTWLERARTLLDLKRYDEAVMALENVFRYDPHNAAASRMMDEVRGSAVKDGKQELLIRHQMYQEEAKERISKYIEDAKRAFVENRLGEARMAADKILLLEPSNKKALKLKKKIEAKLKADKTTEPKPAETGTAASRQRSETKEFQ